MPNYLVFNNSAEELKTLIFGSNNGDPIPVKVDSDGKLEISTVNIGGITGTLDIRPLQGNVDSVSVSGTVTTRALSGATDSIKVADTVATRPLTGDTDSVRIFDTVTIRAL
ncbi:hypothetical protein, partial [Clostridium sp.]|uniref:hypothetical protein n=1 Tax=Clostridium sp. TaxID=1506 RepID=UPI0034639FB1